MEDPAIHPFIVRYEDKNGLGRALKRLAKRATLAESIKICPHSINWPQDLWNQFAFNEYKLPAIAGTVVAIAPIVIRQLDLHR